MPHSDSCTAILLVLNASFLSPQVNISCHCTSDDGYYYFPPNEAAIYWRPVGGIRHETQLNTTPACQTLPFGE